ncbi:MAG: pinensin family lanthipeptide [Bacteroidota bacterium]
MKKLKLNLDEIKVESFETKTENKELKGTVIAQEEPPVETEWGTNCPPGGTWWQSCDANTCFIACSTMPFC